MLLFQNPHIFTPHPLPSVVIGRSTGLKIGLLKAGGGKAPANFKPRFARSNGRDVQPPQSILRLGELHRGQGDGEIGAHAGIGV